MPEWSWGGYLISLLQEFHEKGNYPQEFSYPIHGLIPKTKRSRGL